MRIILVGKLVVSAMTQTPASGPLAPVTTPPMSSLSMATEPPFCWPEPTWTTAATTNKVIASGANPQRKTVLVIGASSSDNRNDSGAASAPLAPRGLLLYRTARIDRRAQRRSWGPTNTVVKRRLRGYTFAELSCASHAHAIDRVGPLAAP